MSKEKYIHPLTDFGFKKLFGEEPNKDLLIDFLNQMLPQKHQIKTLEYSKNEHLGASPIDSKAIFDLFCTNEKGEQFVVELQLNKDVSFRDRSIYYSTFAIQEQSKRDDWNFKLNAVYTIGILDFIFEKSENEANNYLHEAQLIKENGKVFYNKLTYIYIELPKFNKTIDELETRFEKWLFVFQHLASLQKRPVELQESVFEKLFKAAEIAKYTPTERAIYQSSLKDYRDIRNILYTAYSDGYKKGIEQSIKKQGIEQGKESATFLEIAIKMKRAGIDFEVIQQSTGLSLDKIKNI